MSVSLETNFLSEVVWVNSQIAKLLDWKGKNWAVGLSYSTGQPDDWCRSFAQRGINIVAYVGASLKVPGVGNSGAYEQNIAALRTYIEKERQEEADWIRSTIRAMEDYKARSWAVGLSWPDGQPDGFARSFSLRDLPIAYYVRGNVSTGDASAYDKNIETLNAYLEKVASVKVD